MNNKYFGNLVPASNPIGYPLSEAQINPWLRSDKNNSNQLNAKSEEPDISYQKGILYEIEMRSLSVENEMRYIYRKDNLYMIKIQKSQCYIDYIFSNCTIDTWYVSSDEKYAAISFAFMNQVKTIFFDIESLSTGKVFQKMIANGYPVIFKMSKETIRCFESFIAQQLLNAPRFSTITRGFNYIDNGRWQFCHDKNYRLVSPFTHDTWEYAELRTQDRLNLQSSYNVIEYFLSSLTEDIYTQSFLLLLFAYMPIYPILKAYHLELDKTLHFIGNTVISEDIIKNFLKIFNKGFHTKYHLSSPPSKLATSLNDTVNDIQTYYYLDGHLDWNKYRVPNYDKLTLMNSGFANKPFTSIPILINVPLFQTELNRAIIIDTHGFSAKSFNYSSMIHYFNFFTLQWVEFIEQNIGSLTIPIDDSVNNFEFPELRQSMRTIFKVAGLLQAFLNTRVSKNQSFLLENCNRFLTRQADFEPSIGIDFHVKKCFHNFFNDTSKYKSIGNNACIDSPDLGHQIFYSDKYISISSETLNLIIEPLLSCNVLKRDIMELLSIKDLLHKPKSSSYCSTAYLTDLGGNVKKKNVVSFSTKLIHWLELDLTLN